MPQQPLSPQQMHQSRPYPMSPQHPMSPQQMHQQPGSPQPMDQQEPYPPGQVPFSPLPPAGGILIPNFDPRYEHRPTGEYRPGNPTNEFHDSPHAQRGNVGFDMTGLNDGESTDE